MEFTVKVFLFLEKISSLHRADSSRISERGEGFFIALLPSPPREKLCCVRCAKKQSCELPIARASRLTIARSVVASGSTGANSTN
jgi:hypothetical protein